MVEADIHVWMGTMPHTVFSCIPRSSELFESRQPLYFFLLLSLFVPPLGQRLLAIMGPGDFITHRGEGNIGKKGNSDDQAQDLPGQNSRGKLSVHARVT